MAKIKVSADTVLKILQGIMSDDEINYTITDISAPSEWINKTVQQALNIEYYTYKHRPMDTEVIVRDLMANGQETNSLMSLNRSFCILSLGSTERVFSKDNDIVTISANLEYWLQTDKVKLLEDLIEDMSITTNGIRIPLQIGNEMRKIIVVFSSLNVSEIQDTTEYGEMSVCDLQVDMIFYPDVVSRSDYTIEFLTGDTTPPNQNWTKLPFSSISLSNSMTQKAVPFANKVRNVGNINLSRVKSIVLTFDGYANKFIDDLVDKSLASDFNPSGEDTPDSDNNEPVVMRLTRNEKEYLYRCVVKDHSISVQEDTGNETHSLTLTTRGIKNGTT